MARATTLDLDARLAVLRSAGSAALQKIRAKATAAGPGADAVYALAQIPAPALPGPLAAPGTPTGLTVRLNPDGSIVLGWKCPNPTGAQGTIYNLRRRIAGAASFVAIGGTGVRTFTDDTVPAGSTSVLYEITAVRSTRSGPSAQFVVNFGVAPGGEAFASVAPVSVASLAA